MSRTYEQLHNEQFHNQIDKLNGEVKRLRDAISRWAVPVGFHRSCSCKFCQLLYDIAQEEDKRRAEVTSRIPPEADLRLLAIDPPDEWLQEITQKENDDGT